MSFKGLHGQRQRIVVLTTAIVALVGMILFWQLRDGGRFSFRYPWLLLLTLIVPGVYWLTLWRSRWLRAAMPFSNGITLAKMSPGWIARLSPLPALLGVVALALLLVALARPQTRDRGGHIDVEGIDIMIAFDLSQSMEATDVMPNRFEGAKKVIDDFISRRVSDRIGLVVFGKEAYTQCPLTLDYSVLRSMLAELRLGLIDGSATAIGNGLGVSLSRLRKSDAKSRVVVLLTDGESNAGNIAPEQAARYAQAMNVKVYTILIGPRPGQEPPLQRDIFGRPVRGAQFPVNPKLLQTIATQTGGRAFIASDRRGLEETFEAVLDDLDKTERRDVAAAYTDAHRPFVATALTLLLLQALMRLTRWREFP